MESDIRLFICNVRRRHECPPFHRDQFLHEMDRNKSTLLFLVSLIRLSIPFQLLTYIFRHNNNNTNMWHNAIGK